MLSFETGVQNVGVNEMNMGNSPVIGLVDSFDRPGTYEVAMPCPRTRTTALIQLTMIDRNRKEYIDQFALSFHMHWYKFIKVKQMFLKCFIRSSLTVVDCSALYGHGDGSCVS